MFLFFCSGTTVVFCHHFSQNQDDRQSISREIMVAESVAYLQKAIPQYEAASDSQSVAVRVAPIVTVTTGLLDAGLSPDEPLLQASLQFLQRFYDDQKSPGCRAMMPDNLLAKIEVCLDKAHKNTTTFTQHDAPDDASYLLHTLAAFDDSDAVSRAMAFAQNLGNDDNDPSEDVIVIDETRYVVSPGLGRSVRVRDWNQAIAEWETLPQPDVFSSAQFDCLIACVHGLKNYPPQPDGPQRPNRESYFAAMPTVARSHDSRKKSTSNQLSIDCIETYSSLLNAFEPQQSVARRHLLADNLAALQTVRRLE